MIYVAILGFGVVGSGTAALLSKNAELIEKKIGDRVEIKRILDLRDFPDSPFGSLVTHDLNDILSDPDIRIVAEVMGGSHPAFEYTCACFDAGKSVVSSNKEVIANYGHLLTEKARQNGVSYLFEASVGGGIPVLRPLTHDLSANHFSSVHGILNGTTNYILTQMTEHDQDFSTALADAQKKGYAEADPTADVDGIDTMRKVCILGAVAFGRLLPTERVACEGIRSIRLRDHEYAKKAGCRVKLIGSVWKEEDGKLAARVRPCFVPESHPLYAIGGVYNGILVKGDFSGDVMFYGRGAGAEPTASAVVSDIIDTASGKNAGQTAVWQLASPDEIGDPGSCRCRRYVCVRQKDKDAVIGAFGCSEILFDGDEFACVIDEMTEDAFASARQTSEKAGVKFLSVLCVL